MALASNQEPLTSVIGLGCLLFVLPQALVGRYEPLLNSNGFATGEVCRLNVNGTSEFCFAQYGGRWYYIFIFFLGQLLMGAGTTPMFTLGPAYIDENLHPKSSPVYLAIFFAFTLLGPGLGFISGGSLLNIYIDITQVSKGWFEYCKKQTKESLPANCNKHHNLSQSKFTGARYELMVKSTAHLVERQTTVREIVGSSPGRTNTQGL